MMIITIQTISQEFTKNGDEYKKVTGITGDGKQTTKSIFNQLKDKWPLLQENKTLEFKMEQKGQFWNVIDILEPETPPATTPTVPDNMPESDTTPKPTPPAPQEIGMWWKELGESIRSGDIDKNTPEGKLIRAQYYATMMRVLGIKFEHEKKQD